MLTPRGSDGRVLGFVHAKMLMLKVRELTGISDFIFHGLRHLVETKLAELGVTPDIRDRLLDHTPTRGAGKGYDHHAYKQERLAALEKWCAHIARLVTPAEGLQATQ